MLEPCKPSGEQPPSKSPPSTQLPLPPRYRRSNPPRKEPRRRRLVDTRHEKRLGSSPACLSRHFHRQPDCYSCPHRFTRRQLPIFFATHVAFARANHTHPLRKIADRSHIIARPRDTRLVQPHASQTDHRETSPIVAFPELVYEHPHSQKQPSQLVSSPRSC
jgi:hypothetical protein